MLHILVVLMVNKSHVMPEKIFKTISKQLRFKPLMSFAGTGSGLDKYLMAHVFPCTLLKEVRVVSRQASQR